MAGPRAGDMGGSAGPGTSKAFALPQLPGRGGTEPNAGSAGKLRSGCHACCRCQCPCARLWRRQPCEAHHLLSALALPRRRVQGPHAHAPMPHAQNRGGPTLPVPKTASDGAKDIFRTPLRPATSSLICQQCWLAVSGGPRGCCLALSCYTCGSTSHDRVAAGPRSVLAHCLLCVLLQDALALRLHPQLSSHSAVDEIARAGISALIEQDDGS